MHVYVFSLFSYPPTQTLKHTDTIYICINEFPYYIDIYRGFLNVNPVRHWGYKMNKALFSLQQSSVWS